MFKKFRPHPPVSSQAGAHNFLPSEILPTTSYPASLSNNSPPRSPDYTALIQAEIDEKLINNVYDTVSRAADAEAARKAFLSAGGKLQRMRSQHLEDSTQVKEAKEARAAAYARYSAFDESKEAASSRRLEPYEDLTSQSQDASNAALPADSAATPAGTSHGGPKPVLSSTGGTDDPEWLTDELRVSSSARPCQSSRLSLICLPFSTSQAALPPDKRQRYDDMMSGRKTRRGTGKVSKLKMVVFTLGLKV